VIPLFLERTLPETVTAHSKSLIIKSTSYSLQTSLKGHQILTSLAGSD
jgi:hypothetical protein